MTGDRAGALIILFASDPPSNVFYICLNVLQFNLSSDVTLLLRTADNLLLFFGSGRVLLCTSFLTSVSFVL